MPRYNDYGHNLFFFHSVKFTAVAAWYFCSIFSSFMRAHTQAVNEYRGGEMSTEVVDGNLWTEIVDCRRKWKCPASVAPWCTDLVRCPYWPFLILFFFSFIFFNLKLPITLFFYFVVQFTIKTFEKKSYLISRLFNFMII